MFGWRGSEMLFYGGIAVMGTVGLLAAVSIAIFTLTGRRLKKKLEQEYGRLR